jgi:hypothetical protein
MWRVCYKTVLIIFFESYQRITCLVFSSSIKSLKQHSASLYGLHCSGAGSLLLPQLVGLVFYGRLVKAVILQHSFHILVHTRFIVWPPQRKCSGSLYSPLCSEPFAKMYVKCTYSVASSSISSSSSWPPSAPASLSIRSGGCGCGGYTSSRVDI